MELQPAAAEPKPRTRREPALPLAATIGETCRLTGLGRTKIYELIAADKLKAVSIGRRRLVLMASIEALLLPDAA